MPIFPDYPHSHSSEATPIENVVVEVTESGKPVAYSKSQRQWYKVILINPIYHDNGGRAKATVEAFYEEFRLSENVTFVCKGQQYLGMFLQPPKIEQVSGFGRWEITTTWQAIRLDSVVVNQGSYLSSYLTARGDL